MSKKCYTAPTTKEIALLSEGVFAISTFMLQDYTSNGDPIELDF